MRGATWTLCECGTLKVGEGFVHQSMRSGSWSSTISPWNAHRHSISRIIFSENVVMGYSLAGLFRDLSSATTIEGLEYFDTSNVRIMYGVFNGMNSLSSLDLSNWNTGNVTDMSSMFFRTDALVELDVSGWNTSNVTDMSSMFGTTHSLVSLDLSNWDTSRVTNMTNMFAHTLSLAILDLSGWDTYNVGQARMNNFFAEMTNLRSLTLGENFVLRGGPMLPAVRVTSEFTGYWQNVGSGTPERPRGEHVLTSVQLMSQFHGATMADTWVWQPR